MKTEQLLDVGIVSLYFTGCSKKTPTSCSPGCISEMLSTFTCPITFSIKMQTILCIPFKFFKIWILTVRVFCKIQQIQNWKEMYNFQLYKVTLQNLSSYCRFTV